MRRQPRRPRRRPRRGRVMRPGWRSAQVRRRQARCRGFRRTWRRIRMLWSWTCSLPPGSYEIMAADVPDSAGFANVSPLFGEEQEEVENESKAGSISDRQRAGDFATSLKSCSALHGAEFSRRGAETVLRRRAGRPARRNGWRRVGAGIGAGVGAGVGAALGAESGPNGRRVGAEWPPTRCLAPGEDGW